jgi:hypothetical protein
MLIKLRRKEYNLPGFEQIQRMTAQRSKTKGMRCTAFSENLTRAFSLLANSTIGSYVGKLLPFPSTIIE